MALLRSRRRPTRSLPSVPAREIHRPGNRRRLSSRRVNRPHQRLTHWATWLSTDRSRIQNDDRYGLDHLHQAFDGTGSRSDPVLLLSTATQPPNCATSSRSHPGDGPLTRGTPQSTTQRHRLTPEPLPGPSTDAHPGLLPLASRQNQVSTEPGQLHGDSRGPRPTSARSPDLAPSRSVLSAPSVRRAGGRFGEASRL
jgi:hypothetical protein